MKQSIATIKTNLWRRKVSKRHVLVGKVIFSEVFFLVNLFDASGAWNICINMRRNHSHLKFGATEE